MLKGLNRPFHCRCIFKVSSGACCSLTLISAFLMKRYTNENYKYTPRTHRSLCQTVKVACCRLQTTEMQVPQIPHGSALMNTFFYFFLVTKYNFITIKNQTSQLCG